MRMTIRRRLAAAVATLAVVLSIFGGLLAAPAAAQTGATPTLDPIHWEVIPGALTWTADHGFQITVSCRTTTHDPTWLTPGGGARNSILYLHLKLQKPDPAGPIRDQGRRWRDIYWTRNPGTNSLETNAQQCNLFKGVDVVTFPIGILSERISLGSRDVLQSLRVVVRYYKPGRFGNNAHKGLLLTNGQFHYFRPGGFTDNVNDGRAPADSEEMFDDF